MSLRPEELSLVAAELDRELRGGVVQKVYAPTTTRIFLEVRVPGRSVLLHLCSDAQVARLGAVERRPANPATPPTWQSVLRTELTGAKLADVEALPERRTVILHFTKAERFLNLVFEAANPPSLLLCTGDGRIRSQSVPARPGLRVGQVWAPLDAQPIKPQPSRLSGDFTFLRLAHAAEALLSQVEQRSWVDARRAPLLAKLKRLERTRKKVQEEADRTARAHTLRREGELLAQNLFRVTKGQRALEVTEYLDDGSTQQVTLTLDPSKTPQQQVEQRFHQYKRLVRGAQIAQQRLATLEQEGRALTQQLASLDAEPPQAPAIRERKAKGPQAPLPPYREYLGHGGQRLWVGRGSTHNDALTFHVARPFHVWFHARGVPGAHVVVPLEKNQALTPEVMLDAAHLAAHHSDARDEPRTEVSYTSVKFVHKPKDAAPGAVTYSREKTVMLRVEAARLQRLLHSVIDENPPG